MGNYTGFSGARQADAGLGDKFSHTFCAVEADDDNKWLAAEVLPIGTTAFTTADFASTTILEPARGLVLTCSAFSATVAQANIAVTYLNEWGERGKAMFRVTGTGALTWPEPVSSIVSVKANVTGTAGTVTFSLGFAHVLSTVTRIGHIEDVTSALVDCDAIDLSDDPPIDAANSSIELPADPAGMTFEIHGQSTYGIGVANGTLRTRNTLIAV